MRFLLDVRSEGCFCSVSSYRGSNPKLNCELIGFQHTGVESSREEGRRKEKEKEEEKKGMKGTKRTTVEACSALGRQDNFINMTQGWFYHLYCNLGACGAEPLGAGYQGAG